MKVNAENRNRQNSNAIANTNEKALVTQPKALTLPAVSPYPITSTMEPPIQMTNMLTMHGKNDEKAGSGEQQNDDDEVADTGAEVANTIHSGFLPNIQDSHDALERSIAVREEEMADIQRRVAAGEVKDNPERTRGHQIRIRLERGWLQQFKDAIERIKQKAAAKQKQAEEEKNRVSNAHDTDKNPTLGGAYG